MKIIDLANVSDGVDRISIKREVDLLSKNGSNYIIKFYEYFQIPNSSIICIITELCDVGHFFLLYKYTSY